MSPIDHGGTANRWSRDPIVLCVDDEPGILNAVRWSLRNQPYEVITAGSPEEAIGWLEEVPVDLVITDQLMPGMSGTELLHVVRRRFPNTAGALLTGDETPTTVLRGREAGAEAYLTKPWSEKILIGVIGNILRSRRARRDTDVPDAPFDLGGEGG